MTLPLNGIEAEQWMIFNPSDIDRLFAQDAAIDWKLTPGLTVPIWKDAERAIRDMRNALLLPFCDAFLAFIGVEIVYAEEQLSARRLDAPGIWRTLTGERPAPPAKIAPGRLGGVPL